MTKKYFIHDTQAILQYSAIVEWNNIKMLN